jgi:hypothetical protein
LKEQLDKFASSKQNDKPETFTAKQFYATQLYNQMLINSDTQLYKPFEVKFMETLRRLDFGISKEFNEFQMKQFSTDLTQVQGISKKNTDSEKLDVANVPSQSTKKESEKQKFATQKSSAQQPSTSTSSGETWDSFGRNAPPGYVLPDFLQTDPSVPQFTTQTGPAGAGIRYGNSDWGASVSVGLGVVTARFENALGEKLAFVPGIGMAIVAASALYVLFGGDDEPSSSNGECPYKLSISQRRIYDKSIGQFGGSKVSWDCLTCEDKRFWVRYLKNK